MRIPLVGGAYEDRSAPFNAQRCINLYPVIGSEDSKTQAGLYGTPGFTEFCDIGTGEVRNVIVAGDYLYAVCGSGFYQITSGGSVSASIGTLATSTGHVWMEYNGVTGDQIMIVDGASGYIYDISTNTFTQITDADFPGASSLTYQDGYFIVSKPNSASFYISDSYNGLSWSATQYAVKEGQTDNLRAVYSDHRELWLFGTKTTEIWYNSGATVPFDRKVDEILQRGLAAAGAVASEDNTLFWLDDRLMFQKAEGYRPTTISTRQIEYQLSTYSTVSDAFSFCYSQDGHTFFVTSFPTANKTWVYDAATNMWHERLSSFSYVDSRWRANCYAKFGNKHLIGDFANGKIYELSLSVYQENGEPLKARRSTRVIHQDRKLLFFNSLELDMETGVGLTGDVANDPKVMLRWSDDGRTWGNEHWASIGKKGEYSKRVKWNKLGRSRNRIFDIQLTDPVKRAMFDLQADITIGK